MTTAEMLRTDQVAEFQRFADFRHWICSTFVPLECMPTTTDPFSGAVAHWVLGDLRVSRVTADPHLAARTKRLISARDEDYFKVGLVTHGACRLSQGGKEITLFPGDLAIYDCRRPYTMEFNDWFDMSFLMFPCQRLRLPPAAIDRALATRVSSSECTGSLVVPFLTRLIDTLQDSAQDVNSRLADNLLDLLATLFGEHAGGQPTDPAAVRRALLMRVQAWIETNLGEPDLSPEIIARANHVSVRYLHRLFHDEGTSVARWVRERRLDNCRRDLEDPAHCDRGVVAIARRWGFDDPAYFSKIFKASYGEPPGAYRVRCLPTSGH